MDNIPLTLTALVVTIVSAYLAMVGARLQSRNVRDFEVSELRSRLADCERDRENNERLIRSLTEERMEWIIEQRFGRQRRSSDE